MRVATSLRTVRLAISLVYSAGKRELLVILAAGVVTAVCVAGQLLVGRTVLDLLADRDDVAAGDLAAPITLLAALLVTSSLSQAVSSEVRLTLAELVARRTMNEILDVATEVDLEAYESSEFFDRLQRATGAAEVQSTTVVFGLVGLLSTFVVTIGVIAVLASVAPLLLPVALVGYLPIAFVSVRNNRAHHDMEVALTEMQRERVYLEDVLVERIDAKEVRSYELSDTLRRWHGDLWATRIARLRALVRRRLAFTAIGSLVTTAVLVATLTTALLLAARGSITIGDAAVAIVALQQLSGRLSSAAISFSAVHGGIVFLRDFEHFRAELPVIRAARPTAAPPTPPTVLRVEGLGYRYPGAGTDAVRDVSFELRRGQVLAIVGSNGSGKSTLSKMLCRLLPPSHGTVSWNGVDLAACDPRLVQRQIAPVFQDYSRFLFSIRRSIGLGDVSRLDDEAGIRRAATQAGLDELIAQHAEGIDVRLGKLFDAGIDVSGGQWQRLAIARAFFRDAPIVIMDEPSASLDPRAEADLFDLLQSLGRDRIVIFVSHRFATVRSADVVMVLEQGDVVQMGSHDELMRTPGLYRDLFRLQADRYGLTP